MQAVPPVEYLPAGHLEQEAAPAAEPWPAGQAVHEVAPVVGEYLPAGQDVQAPVLP